MNKPSSLRALPLARRSNPLRGGYRTLIKFISCLVVVAFTLTTVLPPSYAQELISPASRFEAIGDTSGIGFGTHLRLVLKTSPASLTPLWMKATATAVLALFLVSCTGNSSQPPGSSSSVTHIQISISNDADLIKALKNPSPEVVMRAIDFAGETKALFAIPLLIEIASNPHAPVAQGPTIIYGGRTVRAKIPLRSRAIGALTKMGAENKEGVSALCGLGINEDRAIGLSAIQALIDLKVFDKASELLCGYLSDTTIQADFRTIAAMRLADVVRETKDKTAAPAILRAYLLEQNSSVRDMIDMVLDVMQPISLGQLARDILRNDSDARARIKAAEFLGQLKDASALDDLQNASQNDLDAQVKQAADEAIQKIKPAQQQKQSSLAPFKLMPAAVSGLLFFPSIAYGADGGIVNLITDHWIIFGIVGLIAAWVTTRHFTLVRPAMKSFMDVLTTLKDAKDNKELLAQLECLEKLGVQYVQAQIFSSKGTGITPQNLKPIKEEAAKGTPKDKVLGMLKAIEFDPINRKAKGIIDNTLKDIAPMPNTPRQAVAITVAPVETASLPKKEIENNTSEEIIFAPGLTVRKHLLRFWHNQLEKEVKSSKEPPLTILNLIIGVVGALVFGTLFAPLLFGWETGQDLTIWPGIHFPYGTIEYYFLRYFLGIPFTFGSILFICIGTPISLIIIITTNLKINRLNILIEGARHGGLEFQKLTLFIKKLHTVRNSFTYPNSPLQINTLLLVLEKQQHEADPSLKSLIIALIGLLASRPDARKESFPMSHNKIGWSAHYEFNVSGLRDEPNKTKDAELLIRRSAFALLAMMLLNLNIPFVKFKSLIPEVTKLIQDDAELPEVRATAIYLLGRLAERNDAKFEPFDNALKILSEMFNKKKDPNMPYVELGYTLYNIVGLRDKAQTEEAVPLAATPSPHYKAPAAFETRPLGIPVTTTIPAAVPVGQRSSPRSASQSS